ncbi:alpha/beta fold hydrolase [Ottowia thiooxydans]|uniref:alpha/beta fold hydrolase n=1 Tax=Ottowia thiooxydans TaxID=219182 RepID=UPI0033911AD3
MLISAALASTLVACGGGGDSDPLRKYREQTVEWTACDAAMMGPEGVALVQGAIDAYGERLRCSSVRAPMDWANPERGDVFVGVTRLAAGKPEVRRGALLMNPGGPGADGLFINTLKFIGVFEGSNPDSAQGANQLRLLSEYDLVGFSPRGTGASTRLECSTNEISRKVDLSASGWSAPANIANAHYNDRKAAEACLKNPVTPYINTDATARDMDLLRGLLGDEKLNYVGHSYGTWLGAWYASLFPERVGKMVLDSSMDFSSRFEEASLAQPPTRQRLLDEVLVPYAVRHAAYFQLGEREEDVRAVIPSLSPRMQAVLNPRLADLTSSRNDADTFLWQISAARGLNAVLDIVDPMDEAAVAEALEAHAFYPGDAGRNAVLKVYAQAMWQDYRSAWVVPQNKSIALSSFYSVFWAVQCNDTSATTDMAVWDQLVEGLVERSPTFFVDNYRNLCGFWNGPKVNKPDLALMKPLDVLFVQTQYDSATFTEGATRFFSHLPAARRVYVKDDYQHGVYPYADSCVDPLVTNYLLGNSPTTHEEICAGHPLEQDALAMRANMKSASAEGPDAAVPPVYKDAQRAGELIKEFKRGLIRP